MTLTKGYSRNLQLWTDSADLFFGRSRSDRTQSSGARCRDAISLGNFPHQSGADAHRRGLYRPAQPRTPIRCPDRHQCRAWPGFLSGRGLSSGFPNPQSAISVHRHQRFAQDREFEASVPRSLSRDAGVGRGDPAGLIVGVRLPRYSPAASRSSFKSISGVPSAAVEATHLEDRTFDRDEFDDRGCDQAPRHKRAQGENAGSCMMLNGVCTTRPRRRPSSAGRQSRSRIVINVWGVPS